MLVISRYTLNETVTKTINFNELTNLRKGFICIGSTQMCSALIMINILIFALPMSSTQVVISGLTGIVLIYFTKQETNRIWFLKELLMWIFMPIVGMILTYFAHKWVNKAIFNHPEARKRIIVLIPYQICFSFTVMFFVALTKNYYFFAESREGAPLIGWYFGAIFAFPLSFLIIARYYMLRRGRALNQYSAQFKAKNFLQDEPGFYGKDTVDSIKFWNNQCILDIYF